MLVKMLYASLRPLHHLLKTCIKTAFLGLLFLLTSVLPVQAVTTPESINLVFADTVLNINFILQPDLIKPVPKHYVTLGSQKILISTDQKLLVNTPAWIKIQTEFRSEISAEKLKQFLREAAVDQDKTAEVVTINQKNEDIIITGRPSYGYRFDFDQVLALMNKALATGQTYIKVPSQKIYSQVITDPELASRGIKEIIALGKSNFAGSSSERRQNIITAARRFDGHILKKGEIFSFNNILESIEADDGFVKELVIKGNETKKELGGGVCQVSTTAFRAAFHGGLDIHSRQNHSYAVPYYHPYGLDAMIYPGQSDFRFKNDTPGDILIQTVIEDDNLSFVFYGTNDGRQVVAEGPFISHYQSAPAPKMVYTDELDPGETKEITPAQSGFHSKWIRTVIWENRQKISNFISQYRSWPARIQKGRKPQSI